MTMPPLNATNPSGMWPPGLELFADAVPPSFQEEIVETVGEWLEQGKRGKLFGKTYTPVSRNFAYRQQSRDMIQFGMYTHANRVEPSARVSPLPPLLVRLVNHLEDQGVFPKTAEEGLCSPLDRPADEAQRIELKGIPADSYRGPWCCTVNIYEPGQWIPPHVDSKKFTRPFFTVSLLSDQNCIFRAVDDDSGGLCDGEEERPEEEKIQRAEEEEAHIKTTPRLEKPSEVLTGKREAAPPPPEEAPEPDVNNMTAEQVFAWSPGPPPLQLLLPTGSVLKLDSDAADKYTHAVPPVTSRRISLTFRRPHPTTIAKTQVWEAVRQEKIRRKVAKNAAKRELKQAKRRSQG
mmetsp:Transcript_36004/g.48677  ORF Transcript_36004/g.48677 Transcript_36004/m.48677 type:complete len:348 (-) Transcript_36004:308-1351(-)